MRSGSRKRTEMTVMTPKAPKVPRKTSPCDCFSASSRAMKNVLSPSSENKMRRNPDTTPSLKAGSPPMAAQHMPLSDASPRQLVLRVESRGALFGRSGAGHVHCASPGSFEAAMVATASEEMAWAGRANAAAEAASNKATTCMGSIVRLPCIRVLQYCEIWRTCRLIPKEKPACSPPVRITLLEEWMFRRYMAFGERFTIL